MYNYDQFLAKNIREKFMNFITQGVFNYTSIIIHMFLFQQEEMLTIHFNKHDAQGVNQSVIHWTELVMATSTTTTFAEFIDSFIHPVKQLLIS